MKNPFPALIITAVVVGAAGFYGGIRYQQTRPPQPGSFSARAGRGQFPIASGSPQIRFNASNRPLSGEILSLDEQSLTLKLEDGSSKIILLPDSVVINQTEVASKTDLTVGSTIIVFGNGDDSGTVTADSINLGSGFMREY